MNYIPMRQVERTCTNCGEIFRTRELSAQTTCLKCLRSKEKP